MNIAILVTVVLIQWGENGNDIINAAFEEHEKRPLSEFFEACDSSSGSWETIILSGIKALYPRVYSALPETIGTPEALKRVLILCGVEF